LAAACVTRNVLTQRRKEAKLPWKEKSNLRTFWGRGRQYAGAQIELIIAVKSTKKRA
jgi:hypothetical protein